MVQSTEEIEIRESNWSFKLDSIDPGFGPAKVDERFKQWMWKGITSYCLVIFNGKLQSYQTLSNTFGLEKQDFYRYLQVRDYFNKESDSQITDEDWTDICMIQANTTNSRSWREFGWKNLVRFFITPKLTALHTGSQSRGLCWRQCDTPMANHYHIFWACPKMKLFWQGIVAEIEKILGLEVDFSFDTIYLGKIPGNV